MDSEAETEHEWSENESESSVHDVREAQVHVAAQWSDTETMRDELEAGENPNVRDYDGSTPLYLVCLFADVSKRASTIECIRLLLAHGAAPNATSYTPEACSPLVHAARWKSSEAVAMLLEAGAEVNAVDSHGFSPLHRAVSSGISDSVQLLLDHGADVNSRTRREHEFAFPTPIPFGATPIEMASRGEHRHLFPLLLRAGAERPTRFVYTSHLPYFDKVDAAGGIRAYEKQHRKALEKTFASKFEDVPEDVVAIVVAFWGHPGCY